MTYHEETFTKAEHLDALDRLDYVQNNLISANQRIAYIESRGLNPMLTGNIMADYAALRTTLILRMSDALELGVDAGYLRRYLNHV